MIDRLRQVPAGTTVVSSGVDEVAKAVLGLTVASVLGARGNGIYALVVLIPTMLTRVLQLGVTQGAPYLVASGRMSVGDARRSLARMWLGVSLVGSALAAAGWLVTGGGAMTAGLLVVSVACFPLQLAHHWARSLQRGAHRFLRAAALGPVPSVVSLAATFALIAVMDDDILAAALGYLAGRAIGAVAAVLATPGDDGSRGGHAADPGRSWRPHARALLGYGMVSHVGVVAAFLSYRADILLLTALATSRDVGVYVVAVQLAEMTLVLSESLRLVLLPALASASMTRAERVSVAASAARGTVMVCGAVLVVIGTVGVRGLQALLGRGFGDVDVLFWLLAPSAMALAATTLYGVVFAAEGRPGVNARIAVGSLGVNLLLNLTLIPGLGARGAALATCGAYGVQLVATLGALSRSAGTGIVELCRPRPGDLRSLVMVGSAVRRPAAAPGAVAPTAAGAA